MKPRLLILLLLSSCSLYEPKHYPVPSIDPPRSFSTETTAYVVELDWWRAFEDEHLVSLAEVLLQNNFEIKSAIARLKQARESVSLARSSLLPSFGITGSASRQRTEIKSSTIINGNFQIPPNTTFDGDVSTAGTLDYEIDFWAKNYSALGAAGLRADSQFYLLRQVRLAQLGALVELYFQAVQHKNLISLIGEQIQVSKDFLELTELRFRLGRGNAVDVFQQKSSLSRLNSLLPAAKRDLRLTLNAIDVLIGSPPGTTSADQILAELKKPPGIEAVPAPVSLLEWRPDVYTARLLLEASEYDIAQAVAERLPQVTFNLTSSFSADRLADLFTFEVFRIGGNIFLPLIDGGRRRAEVNRRKAVAEELLANYSQTYLNALKDVEDQLASFSEQKEVVKHVSEQVMFSNQSLQESRSRYVNGLSDYLAVLIELQRLQEAERRLIQEKTNYNLVRLRLFTALGGVNLVKAS